MSDESPPKPHDIAAGEIDAWRGRCLDWFAKGERAIALTLEAAAKNDAALTIRHLAGHRLADLAKLAAGDGKATERQAKALSGALEAWRQIESRRAFIAHGVATVLMDRNAKWYVQLDFSNYQAKSTERLRWTSSKDEAEQFETELEQGFKGLSAQLGQFRKRLSSARL